MSVIKNRIDALRQDTFILQYPTILPREDKLFLPEHEFLFNEYSANQDQDSDNKRIITLLNCILTHKRKYFTLHREHFREALHRDSNWKESVGIKSTNWGCFISLAVKLGIIREHSKCKNLKGRMVTIWEAVFPELEPFFSSLNTDVQLTQLINFIEVGSLGTDEGTPKGTRKGTQINRQIDKYKNREIVNIELEQPTIAASASLVATPSQLNNTTHTKEELLSPGSAAPLSSHHREPPKFIRGKVLR